MTAKRGDKLLREICFVDIPGIEIGNADDQVAATGCTVVLLPDGATAGVDVRGGAPGTRETDLLKPENYIEKVHAVMLAGGSAFGLDAAAGVMAYLEERGVGFDVGVAKVPLVCGAVLFDLTCGDPRVRPDKAMGYRACLAAEQSVFTQGSVGAGTGATIGKFFGMEHAMKGGLGTYAVQQGDLIVGAVVAVNCFGDVLDPATGMIVAGAIDAQGQFMNCEAGLVAASSQAGNAFAGNTTIGIIVTNAVLSKAQATKIASMAHNGYARTMRPAHTMVDGDTIFALSVGEVRADQSAVGALAAAVMEQAVLRAVKQAQSLGGYITHSDLVRTDDYEIK